MIKIRKPQKPKSLVLFGNGINCEYETAYTHRLVGFKPDFLHINDLMGNPRIIHSYSFINLPGGFLDGDDLGAAKAQAVRWKYQVIGDTGKRFIDEVVKFVGDGKIVLGICNGFQLLIKTGLLPGFSSTDETQPATLTFNDSGKFEDRWVNLKVNPLSNCIFTRNMETVYLPVRHGEGKFVTDSADNLAKAQKGGHVALQYIDESGCITMAYPHNPNGSVEAIAGICDTTGRIFGLMPHPEAYVTYTQHPRWTREKLEKEGDGLKVFRNAFNYTMENR
ncbi:MAG: phosphoribosylformylglycinamidine synthase subunit PurQ [Syntrophobacterales bacterium]|jgi:phosphoribosylformylglycinamidine synthase|nr:phosphoribosylformylglycinamidine synthase subunit PurQ [Syntrophobacterales bacterium]